jgi:hypothetical protein
MRPPGPSDSHLSAGQGNLGVAGEPGALVVPAGEGLVAAFPMTGVPNGTSGGWAKKMCCPLPPA